jgi:Ras-related protein Rab-7A
MSTSFYRGSDVGILVYDTHEPKSLQNLDSWRDEFLKFATLPGGQPPIIVVLGNKADDGTAMACRYSGTEQHFLVSAKTGLNVEQAFDAVCHRCLELEDRFNHDELGKDIINIDGNDKGVVKGPCCS